MSEQAVHSLNVFLGAGAIALQALSVLALLILFLGPRKNNLLEFLNRRFLSIGFFVSLFAVLFSLVYSEIIGFAPCHLCWLQRIFMFPMVFLFGVAMWKKDRGVIKYVFPLLFVGFAVSVYQNFGYYFGENNTGPCDASGVSCYQHLVSVFGGYISIPMLALTAFVALLSINLVAYFYGKRNNI
ncbi:MAG TPA: disulfide bond formation protein B [Candidatus Paceibacterota bacterium]|jgi:disulfide bond formation protein DsbB|nr:disulfide bond formation protein B [Candidatus Paceibacterota bacterium]